MLKSRSRAPGTRLWRALASPTRRRILDKLRDRPRTTGALAAAFPKLSRFAVMQHLDVLTAAKLVLVRRKGRFRFNHINAVPLAVVYERWVSRYAAPTAHAAINLKRFVEGDIMPDPAKPSKKLPTEFRTVSVELEVMINAAPERVWDAMVKETTHWWRKDFLTKPSNGFHIDARIGGKMYEDRGDGNGLVWADVIGVDAPHSIQMLGILSADYGGPAHTIMKFSVEPSGVSASVVKISDTIWGNLSETAGSKMHEGWTLLFDDALKQYVETGKRA